MASGGGETSAGGSSLIVEFERSYADILSSMTVENDSITEKSGESMKPELEAKLHRFTDLARQLETSFLQKSFLLYSQKPELHLKDDSNELKLEIARKDELIRKHNERLSGWKTMLQEVQQQHKTAVGPPESSPAAANTPASSTTSGPSSPMTGPRGANLNVRPGVPGSRMGGMPGPGNPGGFRMHGPPVQSGAGPLAYLEKTTTSIGGGSGGGR